MSTTQVVAPSTQYAVKKRKKPQPRNKNAAAEAPVKSNPSKRHRDRLNTELERLSQLIPLPDDVVNKLDKLSILRLSVAYLRNKSYSKHIQLEEKSESKALLPVNINQPQPTTELSESELAMQALDGFIMVVTQDFNVFYITSTVQDCLGFPQSDVINQSMLDLIHAEDRKLFMKQMLLNPMGSGPDNPPEDGDPPVPPDYVRHGLTPEMVRQLSQDGLLHRSFICRLRCLHDTSSGFLALHFTGHLGLVPGQNRHQKDGTQLPPELGLFLLASPLQTPSILEIRTKNYIFRTKHKLDYTPLGIDQKGRIVLGYTEQELRQQSGYQFIHSADMMHCADAHTKLMRNGQSGLTVFRLLHRANRWQWVTASARLIFNKGVPDYIISTHRPITEQEGEEHLKKRSVAFRFDFTGHASLYASVNPIGAGPPPSNNNRSYGGAPDTKPHASGPKRARMTEQEVDPATLFGAQSFQSMDNYPEGLPNVRPTTEPMSNVPYPPDQSGMVKAESPYGSADDLGYFKQSPGGSSQDSPYNVNGAEFNKMTSPNSANGDSGFSDTDYHPSPGSDDVLQLLMDSPTLPQLGNDMQQMRHQVPPDNSRYMPGYQNHPGHQPQHRYQYQQQPAPAQSTSAYNQPQSWGHNQGPSRYPSQQPVQNQNWPPMHNQNHAPVAPRQQPQAGMMNGVSHDVPIQNGITNHQMPQYTNAHQQVPQMVQQHQGYSNHGPPAQQQQSQYQSQVGHYQRNQTSQSQMMLQRNQARMYQQPQQPENNQSTRRYAGNNPTQNLIDQIQNRGNRMPNGYHDRHVITARPKDNVSVLNSVEISSTISAPGNDQGHKDLQDIVAMLGPGDNPNVSTDQFELSLECQEHTIQFDMDKIAAEFQTSDPMGVVQKYVQNNPTDALALATGNIPDGMRGNGMNSHAMPPPGQHGQYQAYDQRRYDQPEMPNAVANQGYGHQPQQAMHHPQPAMKQMPPNVKNEGLPDDLVDFDLDEFLTYDVPNIEG